jgi:hypothetical protein
MLRHELYSVIHVPRLKDKNSAELFLGFSIGAVGGRHFAVLPVIVNAVPALGALLRQPSVRWRVGGRHIQSIPSNMAFRSRSVMDSCFLGS